MGAGWQRWWNPPTDRRIEADCARIDAERLAAGLPPRRTPPCLMLTFPSKAITEYARALIDRTEALKPLKP